MHALHSTWTISIQRLGSAVDHQSIPLCLSLFFTIYPSICIAAHSLCGLLKLIIRTNSSFVRPRSFSAISDASCDNAHLESQTREAVNCCSRRSVLCRSFSRFFYTNKKEGSAETVFSNGLAYSNHEQFVKKNENVILSVLAATVRDV